MPTMTRSAISPPTSSAIPATSRAARCGAATCNVLAENIGDGYFQYDCDTYPGLERQRGLRL